MNKILLIIRREYITRVRKKIFLIITLLAPLSIGLITMLPVFLLEYSVEEEKIALYDESGIFSGQMQNSQNVIFGTINTADVPYDSLKKNYAGSGFSGILRVPQDFTIDQPGNVEYFSNEQLGLMTQESIADQMNELLRQKRMKEANISPEIMEKLNAPVHIVQADQTLSTAGTSMVLGYIMGFMIYIVMLTYGMMVMRGVMEEKTNRIAEVIISSVKPFQLMMGKIIGIALVGLTQFLIWIILSGLILSVLKGFYSEDISQLENISSVSNKSGDLNMSEMANFIVDLDKLPLGLIAVGFLFFFPRRIHVICIYFCSHWCRSR